MIRLTFQWLNGFEALRYYYFIGLRLFYEFRPNIFSHYLPQYNSEKLILKTYQLWKMTAFRMGGVLAQLMPSYVIRLN